MSFDEGASLSRLFELMGAIDARLARMEENLKNEVRTIADHETRIRRVEEAMPVLATAAQLTALATTVENDLEARDKAIAVEAERRERRLMTRIGLIVAIIGLLWEIGFRLLGGRG